MKLPQLKKRVTNFLVIAATIGTFSCNRGYGCPTNFSIDFDWVELVCTVLAVIL